MLAWRSPFPDSSEVDTYRARKDLEEREKAKRMKSEMAFVRDSSTILPKNHPLFRIQITVHETGKTRQRTAAEFGETRLCWVTIQYTEKMVTIQYTRFQMILEKVLRGKGTWRGWSVKRYNLQA